MNKCIVWACTTWLAVAGAQAQGVVEAEPPPAAAPLAPAVPPPAAAPQATPAASADGAIDVVQAQPPGERVGPTPRVEVVRTPLPPHRHLGGAPRAPVPGQPTVDSALPRSRPVQHHRPLFDGRMALGVGGVLGFSRDRGYDYTFDGNTQRGVDLFAAYDVLRPAPRLALAVGASVRRLRGESRDSVVDLRALNVTLDLSARYEALPVLPVFVRVGIGAARARLAIDDGQEVDVSGKDATITGQFGGGVVLQTAPGWFETYTGRLAALSLGVTVEGGYAVGTALAPSFAGDTQFGIAQRYTAPGKLDTRAPYLRILATLRF